MRRTQRNPHLFIHSSGRCSWPPRPGGRCGWRSRVRQSNLSFSLSCCKVAPPHTWPQPPAGLGQLLSVRTAAGKQLDSSWGAAGEQLVAGEDSGTRIQAVKHFVPVQNAEPELGWAQLSPVTEAASCWQQRVETGGRGEGGPRPGRAQR